jgi:hypothetical protein
MNHGDEWTTGQTVETEGSYQNRWGKKVILKSGDTFPACPSTGKSTNWQLLKL